MVVVSSVTRLRKPIDDRPGDKSKVASERVAESTLALQPAGRGCRFVSSAGESESSEVLPKITDYRLQYRRR